MKFNIDEVKYDQNGLLPVIVQDARDNEVLMLAYMNKDALLATFKTKRATFWSRSRQKYWIKGESSGHVQEVKEIYYDCDTDTLLLKVIQIGDAACHEGYRSCFFRKITDDELNVQVMGQRIFDPKEVYKK